MRNAGCVEVIGEVKKGSLCDTLLTSGCKKGKMHQVRDSYADCESSNHSGPHCDICFAIQ